jgi:DNA-binding beta-propeller fold protein YncE
MDATPPNPGKTQNQRGDKSNQIPAAGTPYSRPKSVQRRGEASPIRRLGRALPTHITLILSLTPFVETAAYAQGERGQPEFVSSWGGHGTGPGRFNFPTCIAFGPKGFVYVADMHNHRVQKFDRSGVFQIAWGAEGAPRHLPRRSDSELKFPKSLVVSNQNEVFVLDEHNYRVQVFDENGRYLRHWSVLSPDELSLLSEYFWKDTSFLEIDGRDRLYTLVTPPGTDGSVYVRVFDTRGFILDSMKLKYEKIQAFDVDYEGRIYAAFLVNQDILIYSFGLDGSILARFDSIYDEYFNITSIETDPTGAFVYIGEDDYLIPEVSEVSRVQVFRKTGEWVGVWGRSGSGTQFRYPRSLTFDADGFLYLVDQGNERILKIKP